jgi:hypothetical protein
MKRMTCQLIVAFGLTLGVFALVAALDGVKRTVPLPPALAALLPEVPTSYAIISRPFYSPEIHSLVTLRPNGRLLDVSGPSQCSAGARFRIDVTVTQAETGAVAEGHTQGFCTGQPQTWAITAVTRGRDEFVLGTIRVDAVGVLIDRGQVLLTHRWGRFATLVRP